MDMMLSPRAIFVEQDDGVPGLLLLMGPSEPTKTHGGLGSANELQKTSQVMLPIIPVIL